MLNILTPAPGTRQFAELDDEGRIFTRRWELYDGLHVVFSPRQTAPHELQSAVLRAYRRFYSTRRLLALCLTLRFARVRDHSWCWWFVRFWSWQRGTRAYLREIKRLRRPAAAPGRPAVEQVDSGGLTCRPVGGPRTEQPGLKGRGHEQRRAAERAP